MYYYYYYLLCEPPMLREPLKEPPILASPSEMSSRTRHSTGIGYRYSTAAAITNMSKHLICTTYISIHLVGERRPPGSRSGENHNFIKQEHLEFLNKYKTHNNHKTF